MAPNLFLCLRTVFCPTYWFHRGERIDGLTRRAEHWDSPVPGIYRYIPGRGWHLIYCDGHEDDEKAPIPLVYCRILHRYIFKHEMEDRSRTESVALEEGAAPVKRTFFRLDDGCTWVIGWDAKDRFIPGPYNKWYLDAETNCMRRVSWSDSAAVSRSSSVAPPKMA